jgi:predicted RNA-binding Zn-ribbon protein involved in translation (DUF1610 family)
MSGTIYREHTAHDNKPDVEPLHIGPRDACPGCGESTLQRCQDCTTVMRERYSHCSKCGFGSLLYQVSSLTTTACTDKRRIKTGRFSRCRKQGNHLHQTCLHCGFSWLCATKEPT